jgi:hypothetical protein
LAKALMAEANVLPFWSRVAFCAAVVLELKNFSQLAVICATAPEVNEALELATALGDEAGADAGDEAAELGGDVEADELELLLQAATVAASARPSAGAIIRRATRLNRMTRLLCLGRMYG